MSDLNLLPLFYFWLYIVSLFLTCLICCSWDPAKHAWLSFAARQAPITWAWLSLDRGYCGLDEVTYFLDLAHGNALPSVYRLPQNAFNLESKAHISLQRWSPSAPFWKFALPGLKDCTALASKKITGANPWCSNSSICFGGAPGEQSWGFLDRIRPRLVVRRKLETAQAKGRGETVTGAERLASVDSKSGWQGKSSRWRKDFAIVS
jgi:hypothetical protein